MTSILAEINALLATYNAIAGAPVRVHRTGTGDVIWTEGQEIDVYPADVAIDIALELAILHDDVVADPGSYHIDTLAHHGVAIPADHPQRAEVIPAECASGSSPDCTGEGTAYAGRCLPCDLEEAAHEEWMIMQAEARC